VAEIADMLSETFGLGDQYAKEKMVSGLMRPLSRQGMKVVVENGRPVSHIRTVYADASVFGCQFKVASIGSVMTREQYRGRGYAGAILEQCLREMAEAGAKVLVVSGDRSLYRRAHCVPAGRLYETKLGPGPLPPTNSVTVRKVTPEDWPLIAPLHQAEPVRFLRPAGFLADLHFWWDCQKPDIWLIETGGEPSAYVMLSQDWSRDPKREERFVAEYAGSRAAMLDGLPAIFAETELDEIKFEVLGHDRELLHLLRREGIDNVWRTLSGTHRLLDLPGLMAALEPYVVERLAEADRRGLSFDQDGDQCLIAYGDERLEISLSEAAPLVLGGPGAPPVSGDLGRVLSAIFPVPFPMPGFNYI
jgi:predicted N-acetyltransferase YhbS